MKKISDAVHPWPCGHWRWSTKACTYAPAVVTKYQKRIYGPILDRIDIHIEVPRVDYEKLSGNRVSETSDAIRQRVQAARERQLTRFSHNVLIRHHLQCRYAHRGDPAILSVAG